MKLKIKPVLHQFTVALSPGDAISDEVLLLQRWLQNMGFHSEIFAEHIHPDYLDIVKHHTSYKPREQDELVVLHYSIGASLVERLQSLPVRFLLIYHNLTPVKFFKNVSPQLATKLETGRDILKQLVGQCAYAVGDSEYNCQELLDLGYSNVRVLPICIDESDYTDPSNFELRTKIEQQGPNLLFVGRMVPNKKQEDLIKLLYFYRRFSPNARLWLVGSMEQTNYVDWLRHLAKELGLQDHVIFAGHVTQQELVTYYRSTDLYVSMSEHEGFGKPLIESMHMDLPILAYHSSAVPDTLGDAGILFHHKQYEALAEVVDLICHDDQLHIQIIRKQKIHVQQFFATNVFLKWKEIVLYARSK